MKKLMTIVAMVLVTICLAAQDGKVPAELNQYQQDYKAQIESATAQIKAKYLVRLDDLKKKYGAKGELESALMVQKEIDSLKKEKIDVVELDEPGNAKAKAVGKWQWPGGNIVELKAGGAATFNKTAGNWKYKKGKIICSWPSGDVDTLTIAEDGMTASAINGVTEFNVKKLE